MIRRQMVAGRRYCAEARALFARMSSQPTIIRKRLINELIVDLKAASVWTLLDAFYVLAAHDSQAAGLNWVSTSYNLTATGSPTFTTDRGYTGGSGKYLDTAFTPSTHGSQNDMAIGVWSRTSAQSAAAMIGAGGSAVGPFVSIYPRFSGDVAFTYLNQGGSSGQLSGSVTDGAAWYLGTRTGASTNSGFRNTTETVLGATSTGLTTNSIWLLAGHYNTPEYNSGQAAAGLIASGLTSGNNTAIYNALSTYLVAVGAA